MYKKVDTLEELQNEWRNHYVQWYAAGMPSYRSVDQKPWKKINLTFHTKEDLQHFASLSGYKITERTNVIWYPEKERDNNSTNRYVADE